jgi:DNA-binding beta-propeller fold protein YncE
MKNAYFLLSLLALLWFSNCDKADEQPDPGMIAAAGVFVLNEGLFTQGNASVGYFALEDEQWTADLFQAANNRPLGDILQSMTIVENQAYLVLNNSQRIEVVDVQTFQSVGAIEGLGSPRYLLPLGNGQAYVSDLFGGQIQVVNLAERSLVQTIPLPESWAEQLAQVGEEVFVACPSSWGQPPSRWLYVIDTRTHSVVDSIAVGLSPQALALDGEGKLWVLCAGDFASATPGGLYRIDPASKAVLKALPFSDTNIGFAPRLAIDAAGGRLYYTKDGLYAVSVQSEALPSQPLIPAQGREFYGLGIEPESGRIWLGDARDYQSRGQVLYFEPNGELIDAFEAGFLPNGFVFR